MQPSSVQSSACPQSDPISVPFTSSAGQTRETSSTTSKVHSGKPKSVAKSIPISANTTHPPEYIDDSFSWAISSIRNGSVDLKTDEDSDSDYDDDAVTHPKNTTSSIPSSRDSKKRPSCTCPSTSTSRDQKRIKLEFNPPSVLDPQNTT